MFETCKNSKVCDTCENNVDNGACLGGPQPINCPNKVEIIKKSNEEKNNSHKVSKQG